VARRLVFAGDVGPDTQAAGRHQPGACTSRAGTDCIGTELDTRKPTVRTGRIGSGWALMSERTTAQGCQLMVPPWKAWALPPWLSYSSPVG
jgi:hypothetical protein